MQLRTTLWIPAVALTAGLSTAQVANISASQDNTLYSESGLLSNGIGLHTFSGRTAGLMGPANNRRALIQFDVAAAVPSGATVTGVRLEMTCTKTVSGPHPVSMHRVTTAWGEGASAGPLGQEGMGGAAVAPDATWTDSMLGTPWGTAGGDFVAAASDTQAIGFPGPYVFGSTAQLIADVQDMLDNPALNFGWILIGEESIDRTAKQWGSAQNGVAADEPNLVVTYTTGPTLTTPFCFGIACPCGNDDPSAGCVHSGGVGSVLDGVGGSTSFVADNLRLDATCPPANSGLILVNTMGDAPLALFDGLNCVRGGPRVAPGADNGLAQPFGDIDLVAGDGVRNFGDDTGVNLGFYGIVNATFPGFIGPGNSYAAQYWFRDVLCGPPPAPCPSPCMLNANFSNGVMFTVTP